MQSKTSEEKGLEPGPGFDENAREGWHSLRGRYCFRKLTLAYVCASPHGYFSLQVTYSVVRLPILNIAAFGTENIHRQLIVHMAAKSPT